MTIDGTTSAVSGPGNITLDGVIEATEGWFNPAGDEADVDQSDVETAIREQREAAEALLLGRVSFEQMRGYWPQQTDDTTGITDYLKNVAKYVVSGTLQDPEWERTTVLRGGPDHEIQAFKSEPGKDIVTTGSITLVHDLIAAGLVDEYRLFVYPVVLGRGQRLFPDGTGIGQLKLAESPTISVRHRAAALPDHVALPPGRGRLLQASPGRGRSSTGCPKFSDADLSSRILFATYRDHGLTRGR